MWLSKQNVPKVHEQLAEVGTVTIGGKQTAVLTDCEQRKVTVFAPGGYVWRPSLGEELLLLKSGDGECCTAGTRVMEPAEEIDVGEVYIMSKNGSSVWLKNDGSLILTGKVEIQGSLMLNGTEIG